MEKGIPLQQQVPAVTSMRDSEQSQLTNSLTGCLLYARQESKLLVGGNLAILTRVLCNSHHHCSQHTDWKTPMTHNRLEPCIEWVLSWG